MNHFSNVSPSRRRWALCPLAAVMLGLSGGAQAGTVAFNQDAGLDYALTLTYSAAMRTERQSDALIGAANAQGDDGNSNFARGAFINNRGSALGEINFHYRNMGVMVRGNGFYDHAYRRKNDNDGSTVNHDGAADEFTRAARRRLGADGRLLDAYAYITLPLASTTLNLRAGRQVVSWGESLYFPNMSGAQAPADATKSTVPGVEVKDILMPTGQVYGNWVMTDRLSAMAYWQWEWNDTELVPVGGYFSSTDLVGPGAEYLNAIPALNAMGLGKITNAGDITPGNNGQWGVGLTYQLGDATEIGLYRLTYHDKNPAAGVVFGAPGPEITLPQATIQLPQDYRAFYADHIRMTAASFSTELLGTAMAGEVSYRQNAGIVVYAPNGILGVLPSVTRGDVWQANLNATKLFMPSALWDTLILVGEVSWMHTGAVAPIQAQGGSFAEVATGRDAGAYQFMIQPGYRQVFPGWDVAFSLIHAQQFKNRAPVSGALGSLFGEGDKRVSVGPNFKYLSNLELQLLYTGYYGSAKSGSAAGEFAHARPLADRSYVSVSAKYSF